MQVQHSLTNFDEKNRTNSLYGFVSVGYDDFLFLEVTDRQDWFSTVKEPVNYASVTGSFIFSELTNISWLNYGKVRGGWAQAGNAAELTHKLTTLLLEHLSKVIQDTAQPATAGNPDLKPELKTTKEGRFRVKFIRQKIRN